MNNNENLNENLNGIDNTQNEKNDSNLNGNEK
jgi:hypothetical protein